MVKALGARPLGVCFAVPRVELLVELAHIRHRQFAVMPDLSWSNVDLSARTLTFEARKTSRRKKLGELAAVAFQKRWKKFPVSFFLPLPPFFRFGISKELLKRDPDGTL